MKRKPLAVAVGLDVVHQLAIGAATVIDEHVVVP